MRTVSISKARRLNFELGHLSVTPRPERLFFAQLVIVAIMAAFFVRNGASGSDELLCR